MADAAATAWDSIRAGWQDLLDRAREQIATSRNQRHVIQLRRALRAKEATHAAKRSDHVAGDPGWPIAS